MDGKNYYDCISDSVYSGLFMVAKDNIHRDIGGTGLIIYLIILILYSGWFLLTVTYKKSLRKTLQKKEHPLFFMYGFAMFLIDRIPAKKISKNQKIDRQLKELTAKENIQRERYLYIAEKLSLSLLVLGISLIIGLTLSITEKKTEEEQMNTLRRGQSNTNSYNIIAKKENGEEETISIDVKKRKMTKEQIYEALEKSFSEIEKEVLGANTAEHVDSPLNFISKYGKNNISVAWQISDSNVIDYDGKIADNIEKEGTLVYITAILQLEGEALEHQFSVMVFPSANKENLQEQLQNYVDSNNVYDNQVNLPEEINGDKIVYRKEVPKDSIGLGLMGVMAAIAIFFLKDKELKKKVNKRNRQLMKDYPEIVSKILLYYGAGLSLKSTLEKITNQYKGKKIKNKNLFRYAYEELKIALIKMNSGISEIRAINEYGTRCGLHSYMKLAGIIEQNLKRGSIELTYALKAEVENAISERRGAALKAGGEISTKLLGPMIVMLIISMAIIMIPAFMSIEI